MQIPDNLYGDFIERLTSCEDRTKSNTHRLNEMDREIKDLRALTISVEKIATAQGDMVSQLNRYNDRLCKIEQEPAQKYDFYYKLFVTALVTAAITAVVTILITRLMT